MSAYDEDFKYFSDFCESQVYDNLIREDSDHTILAFETFFFAVPDDQPYDEPSWVFQKFGSTIKFRAGYKVKPSLDATSETTSASPPLTGDLSYTIVLSSMILDVGGTIALALGAAVASVSILSF